jgi:hypothetical protein
MTYQLPAELQSRLDSYSEVDQKFISKCLSLFAWLSDPANSEEQPPYETDPEGSQIADLFFAQSDPAVFVPKNCRLISINQLHKSAAGFKRDLKESMNQCLDKLQSFGIVSAATFAPSKAGHTKEVRYIASDWIVQDNELAVKKLEADLFNLLTQSMQTKETKSAYDGRPLRFLQTTRVSFGGSSWIAQQGTVVEDYPLCRYLYENNFPVISHITEWDMVQCQRCRHLFDSSVNEYSDTVLIYLRDLIYWYNGSTIKRTRGDLELDSFLQRHLIDTRQPVAFAARDEYSVCPRCGNISARERLLGDRSKPLVMSQPTPAPVQAIAVGAAPATAILAAVETPPLPPPFVDPLTQLLNDLPISERLEHRFWE